MGLNRLKGISKRWDAHCFVKGCKLQKSNCECQDTQDSWSGQPKYRLNSIKLKYTLFQLCSSLWTSCFFINRRTEKKNIFVKYLGQRATPQTFKGSARNDYLQVERETGSALCRITLWDCFGKALLLVNTRLRRKLGQNSPPKTVPQCSSTQHRPRLKRDLKRANRVRIRHFRNEKGTGPI